MAVSAPPAAASVVVTVMRAALLPYPPMSRVLPALKPYQPNHRSKTPSDTKTRLCASCLIVLSESGVKQPHPRLSGKRPMRGPVKIAPTSAQMPPVRCTTPEPAKSMRFFELGINGLVATSACQLHMKPSADHTQCTTTG